MSKRDELIPAERRKADSDLDETIKKASAAAPLLIAMGVSLTSESSLHQLDDILSRLHSILPSGTKQRLLISYGWLLLVTIKVCLQDRE